MPRTRLTPEERLQRERERVRKYRAEHPEKERQYQINKSVNLLRREGWTVIPPTSSEEATV